VLLVLTMKDSHIASWPLPRISRVKLSGGLPFSGGWSTIDGGWQPWGSPKQSGSWTYSKGDLTVSAGADDIASRVQAQRTGGRS
jgi:hypothetical protein